MSQKSTSLEVGPPRVQPALILSRMVSYRKKRTKTSVMLDEDLMAVAEAYGITQENRNLSDDINMAWMKSMMDRGYIPRDPQPKEASLPGSRPVPCNRHTHR